MKSFCIPLWNVASGVLNANKQPSKMQQLVSTHLEQRKMKNTKATRQLRAQETERATWTRDLHHPETRRTSWCPATIDDCPDREHSRGPLREQEISGMQTPNSHKKTKLNGLTETGGIPAAMLPRPSVDTGQEPSPKTTHQTWKGLVSGWERDADEEWANYIRWTLEIVLATLVWRGDGRIEREGSRQNCQERRDWKGWLKRGRASGSREWDVCKLICDRLIGFVNVHLKLNKSYYKKKKKRLA